MKKKESVCFVVTIIENGYIIQYDQGKTGGYQKSHFEEDYIGVGNFIGDIVNRELEHEGA